MNGMTKAEGQRPNIEEAAASNNGQPITPKERVAQMIARADAAKTKADMMRVQADLTAFGADLEDGKMEVPSEVFDVLPNEARSGLLSMFLGIVFLQMQESLSAKTKGGK